MSPDHLDALGMDDKLRAIERRLEHWEHVEHSGNGSALDVAERTFLRSYPALATTKCLDDRRSQDHARLDQEGQVYLDYTGGNLFAIRRSRQSHR